LRTKYEDQHRGTGLTLAIDGDVRQYISVQGYQGSGDFDHRSRRIIEQVAHEVRCANGLDRNTKPDDVATRQMVKKAVWGLLTERDAAGKNPRFGDLRLTDACKLCPAATELALNPTMDEIEAMAEQCTPEARDRRALSAGRWKTEPSTWCEWFVSWFRRDAGALYLPPASVLDF